MGALQCLRNGFKIKQSQMDKSNFSLEKSRPRKVIVTRK